MNLCKDCQYYQKNYFDNDRCLHPVQPCYQNYITGKKIYFYNTCISQRIDSYYGNRCGTNGVWFRKKGEIKF